VGNYRSSLAGVDLNRVYRNPKLELFPTIHALKLMMRRLRDDRSVLLYVDLHGHSRKQNIFVYGCNNTQQPALAKRECVFPKMLAMNGPSHFHFRDCRFNVKANKEASAPLTPLPSGLALYESRNYTRAVIHARRYLCT
jgi:hypothetical protein